MANILLALFTYLISMWSFQHGFLDYVNRSELNRLQGLAKALTQEYQRQQSWQKLQEDAQRWNQLINSYVLNTTQLTESTLLRSKPNIPTGSSALARADKIILLDSKQMLVQGQRQMNSEAIYTPIMFNNRIVGYLGIEKRHELTHELDQLFSRQQQNNYIWIALGAVAIAIGIAMPFSSRIIKPIRELLSSTQAISRGDFHQRVQTQSHDEIGQLSQAFNIMTDNLEKQQAIQEQWLADISHELRTPLAIIKAEVEAILDGVRDLNMNEIQSIHHELEHLNRLVNDLHELSRSDIKTLHNHREEFFLNELIDDALATFNHEIAEKQLIFSFNSQDRLSIFADKGRITQVLMNLIQNNLRYCQQGAQVDIRLSQPDRQTIHICWQDSGPGVQADNLPRLFDRLYREDASRSGDIKGSGLGLSISKQIIDNHGGSISAFHSSLGGLGIDITLPTGHHD